MSGITTNGKWLKMGGITTEGECIKSVYEIKGPVSLLIMKAKQKSFKPLSNFVII